MPAASYPDRLFINGRMEPGRGLLIEVENPTTGAVFAAFAGADAGQLEAAVAAASAAFMRPEWQVAGTRATLLTRLADLMARDADYLGQLLIDEVGTPRALLAPLQVGGAVQILRYYAGLATRDLTRALGPDGHPLIPSESEIRYLPAGVAGIITAYNYPLLLLALKLGPAMAAGCTAVVMPSALTPLATLHVAALAAEAGFPAGTVNIIVGAPEIAQALTLHPLVDRISFTGSVNVGRMVMRQAAEGLKGVTLELGGKSAAIVLPGADLSAVTLPIHTRYMRNAGQGCASPTRILVQRNRMSEFLEITRNSVGTLKLGDPNESDTVIGPLITRAHRERVAGYVRRAVDAGARIICGGGPVAGREGWFFEPTVLADLDNTFEIAREELFGPVGVVLPYDSLDEAIAIANDSPLGLAAHVYGPVAEARAIAPRLRVGSVYINGGGGLRMEAPMGGFKQSGIGREYGVEGLMEYLEPQHIQWPL